MILAMLLLFAQITGTGTLQGGAKVETPQSSILTSIDVSPQNYIAAVGQTLSYTASANFAAPTAAIELEWEDHFEAHMATDVSSQCTWTSSNTGVATIAAKSNPQLVNTVGIGAANIVCTIGAVSGFGQLTVSGLVVSPAAIPNATINIPYSVSFNATGGVPPYTFSLTNGGPGLAALGLQLSGPTLSGTPNTAGSYSFDVQASDSSTPPVTGFRQYQLTVQPPAGTNTRQAQLPKVWGKPHEADFPVPCNSANQCYQKFIHTDGSGDYPCTFAGLQASYNDWRNVPVGQWWEVIVDDGLSTATGGQCRVSSASTLQFNAKEGAISSPAFWWIHSAHPTPNGETVCNHMTAPDPTVDQRTTGCPLDAPAHLFYVASSTITNSIGIMRMGNMDSLGNGPSHIRISNGEFEPISNAPQGVLPINLLTANYVFGDPRSMCSHIGFDHNYVHGDRGDDGLTASGRQTMVSNGMDWGCSGWLNRNYIEKMARPGFESHTISFTDAQPGTMVVGNWVEGNAMQFFVGGRVPSLGDRFNPSDIEMRKNYWGFNPAWIIAGIAAGSPCKTAEHPPLPVAGLSMKNNGEFKIGVRILYDGNIMQWSNACAQDGQNMGITVRACSATICDAYNSVITDLTVTNSIFRFAVNGIQTDGRSSGSAAGLGTSLPGMRWNFINNLFYDIAHSTRHLGAPVTQSTDYILRGAGPSAGSLRWNCEATRDSAGVVTLDCTKAGFRTIASVTMVSTATQANLTTACTTCNIVTINFTPTTTYSFVAGGALDRVSISGTTGTTNLNQVRWPCGTAQGCPGNTGSAFSFRCGSPATTTAIPGQPEPACPTGIDGVTTGSLAKVGQRQTAQSVGDPLVVTGCTDTTFNTAGGETNPTAATGILGPPALAGTNGTQPNGLIVVYQSISGAPASTANCIFRNLQGWWSEGIISHNTMIAQGSQPINPAFAAGAAGAIYPYVRNNLIQDNMAIINPAVSNGGRGLVCCNVTEGINSQRAAMDWGTSQLDHQTFAGRAAQVANYSHISPGCFAAGNCLRGNAGGSTLWFPALGPCPGATVTESGSGWVSGVSANCPGFNGMMNGVPFLLWDTNDPLHDYALQPYATVGSGCTANCGSPYAAGGPREASDHTDMGADMNKIRHAFERTIYDECSAATGTCGTGPNPE